MLSAKTLPPTVVDVQLYFILVRQKEHVPQGHTRAPGIAPGGVSHYLRRTAIESHINTLNVTAKINVCERTGRPPMNL